MKKPQLDQDVSHQGKDGERDMPESTAKYKYYAPYHNNDNHTDSPTVSKKDGEPLGDFVPLPNTNWKDPPEILEEGRQAPAQETQGQDTSGPSTNIDNFLVPIAKKTSHKRLREEVTRVDQEPANKRATNGMSELEDGHSSESNDEMNPLGATYVLDLPTTAIGRVIGKGGETIKALQSSTGASIQVDHSGEGPTKRITIAGSTQVVVDDAKKQIIELAEHSGGESPLTPASAAATAAAAGHPHHFPPPTSAAEQQQSPQQQQQPLAQHMECPQSLVGRIIGRGGETIRALQSASGAHISINQNLPEGQPRIIEISGDEDSCSKSKIMITELIAGEQGSAQAIIQKVITKHGFGKSQVLLAPKLMVGKVIGRGGEVIKQIQKKSGATIQIDQSMDPCRVTIAGQEGAVDMAAYTIESILRGGDPYSLMNIGPSGPAGMGVGGGGGYPMGGGGPSGGHGGMMTMGGPGPGGGGPPGGYYGAPQPYGGGGGMPPPQGMATASGGIPEPRQGRQGGGGGYVSLTPQQQLQYGGPGAQGGGGYQPPYSYPGSSGGGGLDGRIGMMMGGGGGGGGGYQQQQPPPHPVVSGPWQELRDNEGRAYYYNSQSGTTQWEKPHEF